MHFFYFRARSIEECQCESSLVSMAENPEKVEILAKYDCLFLQDVWILCDLNYPVKFVWDLTIFTRSHSMCLGVEIYLISSK